MSEEYSVGYSEGYQAGWNAAMDATPPAQPAPVQEPVAQLGDGVLWCDTCRSVTASTHHSNPNDRDVWCEGEAKWLQGPFYTTPPAAGWNDCRQAMLEMMK